MEKYGKRLTKISFMESRDNIVFLFDMLTMTMRNKNDVVMMSCEVVR